MSKDEYKVDKSAWGPGPWQEEPDKVVWYSEETGLPCMVVRGPMGALCGYAGVYEDHPWFRKRYDDCIREDAKPDTDAQKSWEWEGTTIAVPDSILARMRSRLRCEEDWCDHTPESLVMVHGGLTYSDGCSGDLCHVPQEGEGEVWWFGFDCSHSEDLAPKLEATMQDHGLPRTFGRQVYRDLPYVRNEVERLSRQLKKAGQ